MRQTHLAALVLTCALAASVHADSTRVDYGDGKADGRKSLGGSGQMIRFSTPAGTWKVKGIQIHGSRYGHPKAPDEDFLVYILGEGGSEVIHTESAPYKLFERGDEEWVKVKLKKPVEVSGAFWISLDFRAHQTKGVYVSYDTSTGGQYSKTGIPGRKTKDVDFGGDWMIRVDLVR